MAEIREVKVGDIRPYERNPRRNDASVDAVAESIKQFGFRAPIIVDRDGVIIAGHTRWKAAKKLKLKTVPVIYAEDMTPEQAEAYRIADNSAGSASEWDVDLLAEIIPTLDFDMSDFGLDLDFINTYEDDSGEVIEDEAPEPDFEKEATVKRGEVWKLGDHRLMCGDSTSKVEVEILMEGNLAEMVFTDPPWNVNYGDPEHSYNPKWKNGRTILNDSMTTEDFKEFMGMAFESMKASLRGGGIAYIVMSAQEWGNLMLTLKENGMHWSSTIIWSKDTGVLSRKDYNTQYEPIWYGWEEGSPRLHPVEDHTQTDVWEIKRPKRSDEHPTMKPIELVARAIRNSSNKGDSILDLFGGSGTTLMAAEQTGRTCYMMELDPHYCDVIIERWEAFTGRKAERVVA